jgi:hypothetical protein
MVASGQIGPFLAEMQEKGRFVQVERGETVQIKPHLAF